MLSSYIGYLGYDGRVTKATMHYFLPFSSYAYFLNLFLWHSHLHTCSLGLSKPELLFSVNPPTVLLTNSSSSLFNKALKVTIVLSPYFPMFFFLDSSEWFVTLCSGHLSSLLCHCACPLDWLPNPIHDSVRGRLVRVSTFQREGKK